MGLPENEKIYKFIIEIINIKHHTYTLVILHQEFIIHHFPKLYKKKIIQHLNKFLNIKKYFSTWETPVGRINHLYEENSIWELKGKNCDPILLIFFFVLFFRAGSAAYGISQARCQITAAAAGLCHSHSNGRSESSTYITAHGNAGSLTQWARPGIEPKPS